jgi:hypothetical protein
VSVALHEFECSTDGCTLAWGSNAMLPDQARFLFEFLLPPQLESEHAGTGTCLCNSSKRESGQERR